MELGLRDKVVLVVGASARISAAADVRFRAVSSMWDSRGISA
jgi:hypothetical protein